MSEIKLRDLKGMAEFRAAENLQRAVWGEGDKEDPADLMMVIQQEGGLAAGAFIDASLVGYVFGFPTREPDVQHSHRLAVLPAMRGTGLGLKLKQYQRGWCLERGISLVRWTFDPLRLTNAALNIHSLGALSSTYLCDFYGDMEGINKGVPSDRLMVDWRLDHPIAQRRAGGDRQLIAVPEGRARMIVIPADYDRWRENEPARALEARLSVRAEMQSAFSAGYRICDFDRKRHCYILADGAI